ncbi:hypothetical protein ANANG_G00178750 [Anguilla anguilla]|uniref:Uncharacterized protein n=1 Tax=Anguilla anguilla TaxID=7936 RepID=A0A9D3M848_ANGAN|nr:hypothetical protein ANANG_G00178750 [Anguilla anguilla]
MGCSSSTQTTAQGNRPNTKPEESNGAGAMAKRTENGAGAEDSETIPDPVQLPVQNAGPEAQAAARRETAQVAAETKPPAEDAAAAPAPAEEILPLNLHVNLPLNLPLSLPPRPRRKLWKNRRQRKQEVPRQQLTNRNPQRRNKHLLPVTKTDLASPFSSPDAFGRENRSEWMQRCDRKSNQRSAPPLCLSFL